MKTPLILLILSFVARAQIVLPPNSHVQLTVCAYNEVCRFNEITGLIDCHQDPAPAGTQIYTRVTKDLTLNGGHNHPGDTTPGGAVFIPNPAPVLGSGCAYPQINTSFYSGVYDLAPSAPGYASIPSSLQLKTFTNIYPIVTVPDNGHPFSNYLAQLQQVRWQSLRSYYIFTGYASMMQVWSLVTLRAANNWGGWLDDGIIVPYWWNVYGKDTHPNGQSFDLGTPARPEQKGAILDGAAKYGCSVGDHGWYLHVAC